MSKKREAVQVVTVAAMAVATVAGIAQGTPDRVLLSKDTLAQVT